MKTSFFKTFTLFSLFCEGHHHALSNTIGKSIGKTAFNSLLSRPQLSSCQDLLAPLSSTDLQMRCAVPHQACLVTSGLDYSQIINLTLRLMIHFLWIQIYCFFFKILFIYSWETEREREAETQVEGEAGSMQGGMWDWIPGLQDHALGWRRR